MIQNIIFDMGRVLIDWDPDRIIARLGVDAQDARLLRREVFNNVEWVSMDRGTLSQEEGLHSICRRLPASLHESARACVFDWWKPPLWPTPGMAELIAELKGLGYGIYLLSNATSSLHAYCHRLPGAEHFSGMIVSADWGLLKPQREIYEKLFSTYSLNPETCFFIDDNPPNIDGARCVGMDGTVFFGDMGRLRRELIAAGIPVQEARDA